MRRFDERFIETGIAPEEREKGPEGREAARELADDLTVHLELVAFARERLRTAHDALPALQKPIEAAEKGLADFERRFIALGEQGELFSEGSPKIVLFRKLRDEFREWWNLAAGVRNIMTRVTHEFADVRDFGRSIAAPEAKKEQFYSRGFTAEIRDRETEFAREFRAPDAALFNSGMSAVETIIEAEGFKKGDAIVAAENFYIHTGLLLDDLAKRGIKVIRVSSNDEKALMRAIETHKPKLVLSEVVSNDTTMEVFPVRQLLDFLAEHNKKGKSPSRLVLDNTFLTPELFDLMREHHETLGREKVPLAVLESGTKYIQHGFDNVTAGIVYSPDADYVQRLKAKRAQIGTHLQEQLAAYIPPADAKMLEARMVRHSSNAMLLAEALREIPHVTVMHPSVEGHPDVKRAKELFPRGASGLFYFDWKHPTSAAEDAVNRIKKLADDRGVDIKIGVSFGHPQTWVETYRPVDAKKTDPQYIRVAVGAENIADMKKVIEVFREVLS